MLAYVFILPKGNYRAKGGYIESEISSDDLKYSILSVRFYLPSKKSGVIEVSTSPLIWGGVFFALG